MTAIVGLIEKRKVWLGADSAGIRGQDIMPRKDPKVFANGDFLVAYTDSFRMGQILRFGVHLRKKLGGVAKGKNPRDPYSFMVQRVVPWLRGAFKTAGYLRVEASQESGGEFLVGFKGHLFTIFSDFQIAEGLLPYAAAGCGEDYALGSLFSTQGTGMAPRDRVEKALEAATQFSTGVCPPFRIITSAKR